MKVFQVDECLNSKKFIRQCNSEGRCTLNSFPEVMRGTKDHAMLPALMGQAPLVTSDYSIVTDNGGSIPDYNAGLVMIRSASPKTAMSVGIMMGILHAFKAALPDWHSIDISNILVRITEVSVSLSGIAKSMQTEEIVIAIDDPSLRDNVLSAITVLQERIRQACSLRLSAPVKTLGHMREQALASTLVDLAPVDTEN